MSVVAALLALALNPATGHAETAIPTQAVADNGGFLPYATPPAQPAGLCLVDTGVNLNPDTEGVVVARTAFDGGSGDDASPTQHGTMMAMMAGAAVNGWGMVGVAPTAIRITSVRILEPGKETFPFSLYATGITKCLELRQLDNIRVINLSLGTSETPTAKGREMVANAVERASNYGIAVVAAAGNDDGGPVEYPAATPGVLSVGASDTQGGGLCSFSNRGEGLRLLAPGCDLDGADPATGNGDYDYWQGTSEASAIAAAAIAALEAYKPSLTPAVAEQDLTEPQHGVLDIAAAFRDAGLGRIVAEGEALEPQPQPTAPTGEWLQPKATPPAPVALAAFPRPRARLKRSKRRVELVLLGRPREAQAQVRYLGRRVRSGRLRVLRTLHGVFSTVTLADTGVEEISVRYIDPYDVRRASPWMTLRLPATSSATKHQRGRR